MSRGHEPEDEQVAEVLAAELATLSPEVRTDAARLAAYLAEDFHEVGASGREYHGRAVADQVAAATDPRDEAIRADHLRGEVLAEGVVLVTYTSEHRGARAHRSSVWRRAASGRWEMVHHQGTPAG